MNAYVFIFLMVIALAYGLDTLRTKVKSCEDGTPQPKQVFLWNHETHCYEMPCFIDNHHHLNLVAKFRPAEDVNDLIINTTLISRSGHTTHETENACKSLKSIEDLPGCPIKAHEERLYFVRLHLRTPFNEDASFKVRLYDPNGVTEYCFITDFAFKDPGHSSEEAEYEVEQKRQKVDAIKQQHNNPSITHSSEKGFITRDDVSDGDMKLEIITEVEEQDSLIDLAVANENNEEPHMYLKYREDKRTSKDNWTDLSWIRDFIKYVKAYQALKRYAYLHSDEVTFNVKGLMKAENKNDRKRIPTGTARRDSCICLFCRGGNCGCYFC